MAIKKLLIIGLKAFEEIGREEFELKIGANVPEELALQEDKFSLVHPIAWNEEHGPTQVCIPLKMNFRQFSEMKTFISDCSKTLEEQRVKSGVTMLDLSNQTVEEALSSVGLKLFQQGE